MPPDTDYPALMQQAAQLHAGGQPERALVHFERALALRPGDADAASGCAAMLSLLGQPRAAYQVLASARAQLWDSADGAANLGVAAEDCAAHDDARAAYARALELDPGHPRALTNTALACARAGQWDEALARLARCRARIPGELSAWLNEADILVAARRFEAALALLDTAVQRFPAQPALQVRSAVARAFAGDIARAQAQLDALDTAGRDALQALLAQAGQVSTRPVRKPLRTLPDAWEMFCQQAFDAMQVCDWRDHDRLTAAIRAMEAEAQRSGRWRDGRDAQFYGLLLPLHEDELAALRLRSIATIGRQLGAPMAPFVPTRARDGRIHVGLAVQTLRDPRIANGLLAQLRLHDHTCFALHVYAPTPLPDPALGQAIAATGAALVEIAHLSDDEAVARMRLDALDVFVDAAFDTPWCRPEIPERRVAPIQLRQTTWHRHHPPRPCEYNLSDLVVHPPGLALAPYGAVVRLPHTCWLATNDDQPDAPAPGRVQLGLPADAPVLCTLVAPLMIDPETFACWMDMLRAAPRAVWWLPAYGAAARGNLAQAAQAAGVDPARLVFMQPCSRNQLLARLAHADLFVDTLRFNANHGLVDALRMGVPAVTCAGKGMASRLGASIIAAAGLPEQVLPSPAALRERVLALLGDPAALPALRARLAAAWPRSALADSGARVREWEWAWAEMVRRQRAGQAPAAFDVPAPLPAADGTLAGDRAPSPAGAGPAVRP